MSEQRHLIWVYPQSLVGKLDAATWLETTRELRNLGWKVTLITPGPAGQQYAGDVELLCIARPDTYLFGQLVFHQGCARVLLRQWHKADVLMFHQMSAPWLIPLRMLRVLRRGPRPLWVMDIRDLNEAHGTLKGQVREAFYHLAHLLANRCADGQTAITRPMAELLHIPHDKLWGLWPSGVDLARFSAAQRARRWPAEGDLVHLVYTGIMVEERHLMTLCEAVAQANVEGMPFTLSLIGTGPAAGELHAFAERSGGAVCVVPPVPHDQIPSKLAEAHLGVVSIFSPDQKTFVASNPLKLLEYMAAGLPVLATHVACYSDVVGDAPYVFWAETPDAAGVLDALRQVWAARGTLNSLGQQAAEDARAWTWAEAARKLSAALYSRLQQQHPAQEAQ